MIQVALERLPDYLGQHVLLSMSAHRHRLCAQPAACDRDLARRVVARSGAGDWRASCRPIPGLALLALFYPLLLALTAFTERVFGFGFRAARLPARASGADALFDAAGAAQHGDGAGRQRSRGSRPRRAAVGMTKWQSLTMVELPLAAPVIMAGLRLGGVGDRHGDALHARRADEPGQLHLHRTADRELGVRAVRLRRGGGARARRRPAAFACGEWVRHARACA